MSERTLDIVVLGATGFTGSEVCLHLARSIHHGQWNGISWGIAGRSQERMEEKVLSRLRNEGLPTPSEIFCVDNADRDALRACLSRSRLCLNCTGPYRFLGESVVHACIDVGVDYIDLCGEPEFMQRMVLKYRNQAEAKQVLIMHACAFDSVPADLGSIYAARQFKLPSTCSSVASYLTINTGSAGLVGHATTFEAAVYGFGSASELRSIRKEVQAKYPPAEIPRVGNRPVDKAGPFYEDHNAVQSFSFKFPGADASVVRSTQNGLAERGQGKGLCPHYSAFFTVGGWWGASLMSLYGGVFQTLARSAWGRDLLLKRPGFFTKGFFTNEGPTLEQMDQTSFEMIFIARGYSAEASPSYTDLESAGTVEPVGDPDITVITKVEGPEPGYVATPIIFLAVARCVLEERSTLPVSGGVHTPGSVLLDSSLLEHLNRAGIVFSVVPQDLPTTPAKQGLL